MSPKKQLGARAGRSYFAYLIAAFASLSLGTALNAQDTDHELNHEHEYLHFSHPMVTESPSPDTKLRFDAAFLKVDEPVEGRANEMRAEFEYAFTRSLSLAVVAPYARITSPADTRASGMGNAELSLKAASFAFAHSDALVGGGLTVALPTGSDAKGIGSDHLYELSPFIDAAVRKGPVELVGFLTYSALVNRDAGDANERELTFDGSVLWRAARELELLAEVSNSRSYGASDGSYTETFIAPGVKWRPAKFEKIAVGVSAIRGVGNARGTNAVQVSAFYHF